MLAPWVGKYIGLPFRFGASGPDAFDCWGLVRFVLREEFGISLPAFSHEDANPARLAETVADGIDVIGARRVEKPGIGDLVLMMLNGGPTHVGVVVGDDGESRNMLHTLHGHDSALDSYRSFRWSSRVEGFYRVR